MNILNFNDYLLEYVDMSHVKKILSTKKLKHSKRVGELTKKIKNNDDIYSAAVYHDFLERGGDMEDLEKILSPYALKLVNILTNEDDIDTLLKLKISLSGKPQNIIDDVLIIKLCDRYDNLKKRISKNDLSKEYFNKSVDLIQYIIDNCRDKKIKEFLYKELFNLIPKISTRLRLV